MAAARPQEGPDWPLLERARTRHGATQERQIAALDLFGIVTAVVVLFLLLSLLELRGADRTPRKADDRNYENSDHGEQDADVSQQQEHIPLQAIE